MHTVNDKSSPRAALVRNARNGHKSIGRTTAGNSPDSRNTRT